jgi:SAM-dependent methyltransferase
MDELRRDWTRLGGEDPLWAVCVAPGKRHGGWGEAEFLATGRAEVDAAVEWLERLGSGPGWGRVLDFGCGAGRLSQALARHADAVVGVDISPGMLDTARRLNTAPNCEFVLNDGPDLRMFGDGSFDLVYTALVLQHLPRPMVETCLAEFLRVLRPGGVAVAQTPTSPRWTFRGALWRFAPWPLLRFGQRVALGYPAPMRMTAMPPARLRGLVTAHGGVVLAEEPDEASTRDWRCTRYVIRRD